MHRFHQPLSTTVTKVYDAQSPSLQRANILVRCVMAVSELIMYVLPLSLFPKQSNIVFPLHWECKLLRHYLKHYKEKLKI